MTQTLKGVVVRIVHISPTGGAIFRLLPQNTAKSVRIVASSKAIPLAPCIGEFLTVRGEYVNERIHGYQLQVIASTRGLPAGRHIVNLLVSHPQFSWVGTRSVKRLWNALGERLHSSLASSEVAAISVAGDISLSDALRLIRSWRVYAREVSVAEFFVERGLPLSALAKAIELWGDGAMAQVSNNPYCLASFTPWTELDEVFTVQLGYKVDDESRLIAACQSCIDEYVHRNRSMGIPMSVLLKRLTTRLGKVALAKESTRLARMHDIFSIGPNNVEQLLQPVGTRILEQAFREWVTESAGSASTNLPGDSKKSFGPEETLVKNPRSRVAFLPVTSYHATNSSAEVLGTSIHVFPSSSMCVHFGSSGVQTTLYGDLIRGVQALGDSSNLVLYGADSMDIAIATALLYALPRQCHITIVCPLKITSSSESFWNFLLSLREGCPTFSLDGVDTENQQFWRHERQEDARTVDDVFAETPFARKTTALTNHEAEQHALALYRERAETSTAILLTAVKGDAVRLNEVLHSEHVDLRHAMQLDTPFVKIYNRKDATLGARVVARSAVYDKHIWAGATGVVAEILTNFSESNSDFTIDNLVMAVINFDTIGRVGLTSQECGKMDFGYALPLSLDRWSASAHRILILTDTSDIDVGLLSSSISRTKDSFVCIERISVASRT